MDYKDKYLKYKQKYLKLKIQLGGNNAKIGDKICDKNNLSNVLGNIIKEEKYNDSWGNKRNKWILDTGIEINKNDENKQWIICNNNTPEETIELFKNNIEDKLNEYRNRKYLIYEYESKKFNNIDGFSVLPNYDIIIINDNLNEETYIGNKIIFKIISPINGVFNIENIKIIKNNNKIFDKNVNIYNNNDYIDNIFYLINNYIFDIKIYVCDWNDVGGRFGNNIIYLIWWCLSFIDKNNIGENIIIGMLNGYIKSKILRFNKYKNICNNNDDTEIFYPKENNQYGLENYPYNYELLLSFKKCNNYLYTENIDITKYNILNKKDFIGNLLVNLIEKETLEIINLHKNSFINNTCLHYRGSDFCHTPKFYVLHFRYYLESLELIFEKITENNITIDIYNHPDDNEIIELMIVYLKYNLNKKYSNISIIFRKEKDIFDNIGITEFNELNILYTMSLCKNIILGNSSLSLWSPFISQNSTIYYIYNNHPSDYKINFYPLYSKLQEILYPLNCINILNKDNEDYYLKYLIKCVIPEQINYHIYFILLYIMYFNKDINYYIENFAKKIDNANVEYMDEILIDILNTFNLFKENKLYFKEKNIEPEYSYIDASGKIYYIEKYVNHRIFGYFINILNSIHEETNINIKNKILCDFIDFLSMDNNNLEMTYKIMQIEDN